MSTSEKVIEIVTKQLSREPGTVTMNTNLIEAGYESLDVIETIFAIEEEWGLYIDFNANSDSMENFTTVADVVALVDETLAKKNGAA